MNTELDNPDGTTALEDVTLHPDGVVMMHGQETPYRWKRSTLGVTVWHINEEPAGQSTHPTAIDARYWIATFG